MKCRVHGDEDCGICKAAGAFMPDTGPAINGVRVPARIRVDYDQTCSVWKLWPETFFEHEGDELKAARELGEQAASIGHRLDVLHIVDVTSNDPNEWLFEHHGRTEPSSVAKDMHIRGIPKLGMREAAIDAYAMCKLTGEPDYHLVQHDISKRYRRLLMPVMNTRGYVRRIINAIMIEMEHSQAA